MVSVIWHSGCMSTSRTEKVNTLEYFIRDGYFGFISVCSLITDLCHFIGSQFNAEFVISSSCKKRGEICPQGRLLYKVPY